LNVDLFEKYLLIYLLTYFGLNPNGAIRKYRKFYKEKFHVVFP